MVPVGRTGRDTLPLHAIASHHAAVLWADPDMRAFTLFKPCIPVVLFSDQWYSFLLLPFHSSFLPCFVCFHFKWYSLLWLAPAACLCLPHVAWHSISPPGTGMLAAFSPCCMARTLWHARWHTFSEPYMCWRWHGCAHSSPAMQDWRRWRWSGILPCAHTLGPDFILVFFAADACFLCCALRYCAAPCAHLACAGDI